jgi:hypothetical protein
MPSGLSFILSPSSNWQFWTPSHRLNDFDLRHNRDEVLRRLAKQV